MIMNKDFLDIANEFVKDHNMVLLGVLVLGGVFVAVFFLKTFWGQWDNRTKQHGIYGSTRK